jgi:hypothetical protein
MEKQAINNGDLESFHHKPELKNAKTVNGRR